VQNLLTEIITTHAAVVFNGDGYSDKWQIEAAERGLPNLRTTLDALPELITEPSMELFERYKVFNRREMHSRYEIGLEHYVLAIGVEARLTLEIGSTLILPAAVRYQTGLALNLGALKAAGVETDTSTLTAVTTPLADLRAALSDLKTALAAHTGDRARGGRARPRCTVARHGRGAIGRRPA